MIKIGLRFDESKIRQLEEDYKKLVISVEQKQLIEQMSSLMEHYLPLSKMVVRGNTWHTILEWQLNNKMMISDLSKMPPQQRLAKSKELFMIGKERMKKMLINEEGQEDLLDATYEKAWNIYTQHVRNS